MPNENKKKSNEDLDPIYNSDIADKIEKVIFMYTDFVLLMHIRLIMHIKSAIRKYAPYSFNVSQTSFMYI